MGLAFQDHRLKKCFGAWLGEVDILHQLNSTKAMGNDRLLKHDIFSYLPELLNFLNQVRGSSLKAILGNPSVNAGPALHVIPTACAKHEAIAKLGLPDLTQALYT